MTIAASYARALHQLVSTNPSKGSTYIANLRASLAKRGHLKLLPKIVSEYQKLDVGKERAARNSAVTPEKERTRILLGLYKKLIETK